MTTVLDNGEGNMRQSSLQERLEEMFRETVRVRDDARSDRITVKECNGRASELERQLKGLEQEFKSAGDKTGD
jgi:hypothetical protein